MLCSLTIKGFGILFSNQEFESKHDAQRDFEFQYEDKTGNKWKNRDNFQKVILCIAIKRFGISSLYRWPGSSSPLTSTWEVTMTKCKSFQPRTANPNCPRLSR